MSTAVRIAAADEPPVRGFALLHKSVAYVLAYLGLFGLALGGELDVPSTAVLGVGYAATWRAEGARLDAVSWQRGWTLALLVELGVQAARGALGEPWLASALVWTGALQIARLANRRTAREYLQIALLSFLHLCAATVLSTEITYGLAFLGFIVVIPWMLALTHLRAEIESQHLRRTLESKQAETQTRDDERVTLPPGVSAGATNAQLARVLSSRRLVGAPFLVGTAVLSLPLFAMTAALFVAFPRVGLGMLAFGGGRGESVAGFGNEVELGQVGRIRDDPTIVVRVTPRVLGFRTPTVLDLYLRGSSFDHYDGRRWSRTQRSSGRRLPHLLDEYPIVRSVQRDDIVYDIVLDAFEQAVVLLPEHTVSIEVPPHVANGLEEERQLTLYPGMDLRYEDHTELGLRYTAYVSPTPFYEVFQPLEGDDLARYLQVPDGHERLGELARAWTEGARTDRERAEQIVARLHAAPFSYSLDMRDPGDRPPLERFLFEWRAGHCEYYASAMAILLRTVGVPSRNVTGFLGGRWNTYGRYYAVRSGDAHAWVEAYLPNEGWVSFDPTPSGRDDVGLAESIALELRNVFDAAVVWWELHVVSFDLRSQRDIARDALRWLRGTRVRGSDEPSRPESPRSRIASPVGVTVVGGLLAIGLWLWWRRAGRAPPEPPLPERVARVVALYRSLEAAMAERGVPRPPQRTPHEHAAALASASFAGADLVTLVTDRYNEARFGTTELDSAEIAALESRVRALAKAA